MMMTTMRMTRRGLLAALATIPFVGRVFGKPANSSRLKWNTTSFESGKLVLHAGDRLQVTLTAEQTKPSYAFATLYDGFGAWFAPLRHRETRDYFIADRDYVVISIQMMGAELKALRIERNGDA